LILGAISACGSPSTSSGSGATTASTPTSGTGAHPLGTTVTTSAGDSFAVLAFQPVQGKDASSTPPPGGAFGAADIKECSGNGHTLTTNPKEWSATYTEGNQADGRDASLVAIPGAPLPTSTTVASGQCAEGWVVFTGFADGTALKVQRTGADFWWTVP
jgi:hypothetical protein